MPYCRTHAWSSVLYLGTSGKKQLPQDKPVVFHSRIRSSGYGRSPSSIGHKNHSRANSSSNIRSSPAAAGGGGGGLAAAAAAGAMRGKARSAKPKSPTPLSKQYPIDCGPLIHHQAGNDPPSSSRLGGGGVGSAPLLHLAYGGDTQTLATASMDGTVHLYRLPISKHRVSSPPSGLSLMYVHPSNPNFSLCHRAKVSLL